MAFKSKACDIDNLFQFRLLKILFKSDSLSDLSMRT